MTSVLVAATLAPYKTGRPSDALSWLLGAEDRATGGVAVEHFAALEVDARGLGPYDRIGLLDDLDDLDAARWSFSLDTGASEITTSERLHRICTGRNAIADYAARRNFDWVLYLDSDMRVPSDSILRLLDVDWPIVGGDVPHYCLSGPPRFSRRGWSMAADGAFRAVDLGSSFGYPVEAHWNTAGFLLVERRLSRRLRWRYVPGERIVTDDPCYAADALALGWETLVRKDLVGQHAPLVPVEYRGHDLEIRR